MLKRWIVASALVGAVLAPVSSAGAHEPEKGRLQIELQITPKGVAFKFGLKAAETEATPSIDAFMPAYVEQWLQHMGDVLAQPGRAMTLEHFGAWIPQVGGTAPAATTAREKHAQHMYEMAEIHRRLGHFETARVCYQRVHFLTPTTRLGQIAIDRIQEMEERLRDAGEESGHDDPEAVFNNMLNRTIPLGLVEVSY